MNSAAVERMHTRARAVRARAAVRSWSFRQRNHAAGVWFRLRRVLADAREAYVIGEDDARQLVADGYDALPCGREIAPEKTILFVDESRLAQVRSRRPIPVRLGPQFLDAPAVALVRFED